jgi:hypothetical protein
MSEDLMPNFEVPQGAKKTDKEYLEEIIKDMMCGWVPAKLYMELYGETIDQIKHRVKSGIWRHGEHYTVPRGGSSWVNIPAIRQWLDASLPAAEEKGPEGPSETEPGA